MERCTICNKTADLHKGNKALCAQHYVEMSDSESLYWDLHALLHEDMLGNNRESPRRLFEAIKKKHPHLIQRYYYRKQAKQTPLLESEGADEEMDEDLSASYALLRAREHAQLAVKESQKEIKE